MSVADAANEFIVECRDALYDQASSFTCREADTIANLFRVTGHDTNAEHFLQAHALSDIDAEDLHRHLRSKETDASSSR